MDAWLSQNYKTVILALSVLLGWQLLDRLVPRRVESRPAVVTSSPAPQTAASYVSQQIGKSTDYSISSTGKRHNAGCRYYNPSKPCGSGDGTPCKICGG